MSIGGLDSIFTDCELRKGRANGVRMTEAQIKRWRNKTQSHFIYYCRKCFDDEGQFKHPQEYVQLSRINLDTRGRTMFAECVNCGEIIAEDWHVFGFTRAQAQRYQEGKVAKSKRGQDTIKRAYAPFVEDPSIPYEADGIYCGDGCGCPEDTTGRPTMLNNYGGMLLDVGVIKGLNLAGPNGEYVMRGGSGLGLDTLRQKEVFIFGRGWVKTEIKRVEGWEPRPLEIVVWEPSCE